MNRRFRLSARAIQDINDIWDYTALTWNDQQAEAYIRQLQASMALLVENPDLGRPVDNIRRGYRCYPAGSHLLFYRQSDTQIEIMRILHRRMDMERHL